MSEEIWKPGEHCGNYQIVRLLGAGGFAQVYEVVDPSGARRALKMLATDVEGRAKLRARLAQEGTALALVAHPNVVQFFDAGMHEDRIYLVLELVHGKNLREAIAEGGVRPPPLRVARWIHQAAEGIAEAHRMGVVHRDLKPENILVTAAEQVKVIDFGIAKLSSFGVKTTNEQRLGTALYMSPEHIQGGAPDPRMDVYALGLVAYEAITGQHPISTGPSNVAAICSRQISHRPPPLASVAPWAPPELCAAIDRAIEKEVERRTPSMIALSNAVADVIARAGESPSTASRRFGGTQIMPAAPVSRPMHLAATAPLTASAVLAPTESMGPLAASAPASAPVRQTAIMTAPPPEAIAAASAPLAPTAAMSGGMVSAIAPTADLGPLTPIEPTAPPIVPPVAAKARPARRSRGTVAVIVAAALLGVGGGTVAVLALTGVLDGGAKSAPAKPAPKKR